MGDTERIGPEGPKRSGPLGAALLAGTLAMQALPTPAAAAEWTPEELAAFARAEAQAAEHEPIPCHAFVRIRDRDYCLVRVVLADKKTIVRVTLFPEDPKGERVNGSVRVIGKNQAAAPK